MKSTSQGQRRLRKEPGTGICWFCYTQGIILKRAKVGPRGAAIDLYRQRKTELRTGAKLAPNLRTRGIRFGEIAEESLAWSAEFHTKDIRTVTGTMKMVVAQFGEMTATEITPQIIDRWLMDHSHWAPTTELAPGKRLS